MDAFLAEACIHLSNAPVVIDLVCDRLLGLCTGFSTQGNDRLLTFGMGRAVLRAAGDALLMRVEADDMVACHSIKVSVEGTVAEVAGISQAALLWIAAKKEPFAALAGYAALKREQPAPDFIRSDNEEQEE
ncbi:MAG: hypothetical protein ABII76_17750 [Pseudomonadota bacterium]